MTDECVAAGRGVSRAIARAQMFRALGSRAFRRRTPDLADGGGHATGSTYSLWDLLCVGVGATVGSGVFVVTGQVAQGVAGPAVVVSWILAGVACCLSAMAYAELTCRWPSGGSAYTYAYATLGEWPAVLTAWALSLECGFEDAGFNVYACVLQLVVTLIFLRGVEVGKRVVNGFTVLKTFIVVVMIVGGLCCFKPAHLVPFVPMGINGVMRGTTTCFFGFLGYDEVCCLAAETKNPQTDLPLAIFGTIATAAVLYSLSSLALVGMTAFAAIDPQNSFFSAFLDQSAHSPAFSYLALFVTAGELCTMPLVVMASFLPQPRILAALARDGLAPASLAKRTHDGNLFNAIALAGFVCVCIASFVPYTYMNNLISGGVLLSFNLTNVSLILLRRNRRVHAEDETRERRRLHLTLCEALVLAFVVLCIIASAAARLGLRVWAPAVVGQAGLALAIDMLCIPVLGRNNYSTVSTVALNEVEQQGRSFQVPLVPYVPLLAISMNTYLIMQLTSAEFRYMLALFAVASLVYAVQVMVDHRQTTGADDHAPLVAAVAVAAIDQASRMPFSSVNTSYGYCETHGVSIAISRPDCDQYQRIDR